MLLIESRYLEAVHNRKIKEEAQSTTTQEANTTRRQARDRNENNDDILEQTSKPKTSAPGRKGGLRRTEYLTKSQLDFRPYVQRKQILNDLTLDTFLRSCPRRFRRPAVVLELDEEYGTKLFRFAQEAAPVQVFNQCF